MQELYNSGNVRLKTEMEIVAISNIRGVPRGGRFRCERMEVAVTTNVGLSGIKNFTVTIIRVIHKICQALLETTSKTVK